jgi:hypothetical protein
MSLKHFAALCALYVFSSVLFDDWQTSALGMTLGLLYSEMSK